jgi:CHAT domain
MLAGEILGRAQPGLILTPPMQATDLDDRHLSASEVASLKLDADWVILSACNTAAGGAKGAEALSGLARAFTYAGARAFLVSHWSVDSAATVSLITHAVGAISRDRKLGRAEAPRRGMLAMIDKGSRTRRIRPTARHSPLWVKGRRTRACSRAHADLNNPSVRKTPQTNGGRHMTRALKCGGSEASVLTKPARHTLPFGRRSCEGAAAKAAADCASSGTVSYIYATTVAPCAVHPTTWANHCAL